jgi:ABC-type transport system substrate-binding protein
VLQTVGPRQPDRVHGNENYYGQQPAFDTLVYRWATEGAQRLLELQSGNVDMITNPSPEDFDTIQNDPTCSSSRSPTPTCSTSGSRTRSLRSTT